MAASVSSRYKVLGVVLLVAMLAALAWFLFGRQEEAGAPAAQTSGDAAASPAAEAPVRPKKSIEPLPPVRAPLAQSLPELQRRAAAGEGDAACRIATGLAQCIGLEFRRQQHDRWLAQRRRALALVMHGNPEKEETAKIFSASFERELAIRERPLNGLGEYCRDVPVPTPAQLAAAWRRAAQLGNPAAMRHYAGGGAFSWWSILDTAPLMPTYRAEAEAMALSLARRGDLETTVMLASAYSPLPGQTRTLLGQVVAEDGARALMLYRRVQAALQPLDTHEARSLSKWIGIEVEQLEYHLPEAERARAAGLLWPDAAEWSDVQVDHVPRNLGAQGSMRQTMPDDCQAPGGRHRPMAVADAS